jgi:hypothetical protein
MHTAEDNTQFTYTALCLSSCHAAYNKRRHYVWWRQSSSINTGPWGLSILGEQKLNISRTVVIRTMIYDVRVSVLVQVVQYLVNRGKNRKSYVIIFWAQAHLSKYVFWCFKKNISCQENNLGLVRWYSSSDIKKLIRLREISFGHLARMGIKIIAYERLMYTEPPL